MSMNSNPSPYSISSYPIMNKSKIQDEDMIISKVSKNKIKKIIDDDENDDENEISKKSSLNPFRIISDSKINIANNINNNIIINKKSSKSKAIDDDDDFIPSKLIESKKIESKPIQSIPINKSVSASISAPLIKTSSFSKSDIRSHFSDVNSIDSVFSKLSINNSETFQDSKSMYNTLVREAKNLEDNDLELSYEKYLKASSIFPGRVDLEKKIKKLEVAIESKKKELYMNKIIAKLDESPEMIDEWFFKSLNPLMYSLKGGFTISKAIYDRLYDYQRYCIYWLWNLHNNDVGGGILGDDMGLGKTVQITAFLNCLIGCKKIKSVLLVCPVSVIDNWKSHIKDYCNNKFQFYHGTPKQRSEAIENVVEKGGILITTYGMITKNSTQLSELLVANKRKWDYVILDEGHRIKNNSTLLAKEIRNIPAHHRLIVTGTPLQNSLDDLWSLFDFSCFGNLLGEHKSFKNEFILPIVQSQDRYAGEKERQYGNMMSKTLQGLIHPFFLRRTKAEIIANSFSNDADIIFRNDNNDVDSEEDARPSSSAIAVAPNGLVALAAIQKNDIIVWCKITQNQHNLYQSFIELDSVKAILNTTQSPLAALTVMKKICDHTQLLRADMKLMGELQFEWDEELYNTTQRTMVISEQEITSLCQGSVKLSLLLNLVEDHRQNSHRTLIFCQSKKMLNIISSCLSTRRFKFLRIDGDVTKHEERQRLINSFNKDYSINCFLLTTQTGGLGVTLTGADRVIIFDPHWNPCADDQAVDRAYRIGQSKSVVVYRLITCGTIEEKIYRKQIFKSSLFQATVTAKESGAVMRYFSRKEIRALFVLEDHTKSDTQIQLKIQHEGQRASYPELDLHLSWLEALNGVYGISDHDLMFKTRENVSNEIEDSDFESKAECVKERLRNPRSPVSTVKKTRTKSAKKNLPSSSSPEYSQDQQLNFSNLIDESPLVISKSVRKNRKVIIDDSDFEGSVKKPDHALNLSVAKSNSKSSKKQIPFSPKLDQSNNIIPQNLSSQFFIPLMMPEFEDRQFNLDDFEAGAPSVESKNEPKRFSIGHNIIASYRKSILQSRLSNLNKHDNDDDFEPGAEPSKPAVVNSSEPIQEEPSQCCEKHYLQVVNHFQGNFECSKCSCFITAEEKEEFNELKKLALLAISQKDDITAFDLAAEALFICDDDIELQEFVYTYGSLHKDELSEQIDIGNTNCNEVKNEDDE